MIGAIIVAALAAAVLYGKPFAKRAAHAVETHRVERRNFAVTLNEKGELQATHSVDVKCEVEGRSTIIWLIAEGTEVKEGDLLVKIASNEIDERVRAEQIKSQNAEAAAEAATKELEIALDQHASDIRKAELALRNAETALQKYTEGEYPQQLLEKELALQTAKETFKQKTGIFNDSKKLRDQGFLTERELDERSLQKLTAEVNVQKAEIDLATFKNYTYPSDLEQKQSDVAEAKKDLDRTVKKTQAEESKLRASTSAKQAELELIRDRLAKLLEQQSKTEIHAPAPGLVVYFTGRHRWDRVQMSEGAEVYERQTIIQLPDPSQMMVKLRIHEAKTSKIAVGQRTIVGIEGIPGVTFEGKVSKIAPLADSQNMWLNPDLKEYDTEVTLERSDYNLKPGVTARAEILVQDVQDVVTVPVQAVFSRGGHHYVFRGTTQKTAEPVEIEVGIASDEYVEVTSGIEPGDTVLLAVDDTLLAEMPSLEGEGNGAFGGRNGAPAQAGAARTKSGGGRGGRRGGKP